MGGSHTCLFPAIFLTFLQKIYSIIKFDAIYVNEDYTPYSIKRDKLIKKFCQKKNINFISSSGWLLIQFNATSFLASPSSYWFNLFNFCIF